MPTKRKTPMQTERMMPAQTVHSEMRGGGHLYMQTNEVRNFVVRYRRTADGAITEVERTATGGAGSGTFKPTSGQESAPNDFEGAGSVILSPDRVIGLNRVVEGLAAGQAFYEPPGANHTAGDSANPQRAARILAIIIAPVEKK